MTESQKVDEWARFFTASQPDYKVAALQAVLKNDGEKVLGKVVQKLKLEATVDFVRACL